MAIKFFWNGIKGSDGKLRRCTYSAGHYTPQSELPTDTITIYAKDYGVDGHFPLDVCEAFEVENDTDSQTDYFETDRIRVRPSHPLYAAVKVAMLARTARFDAKYGRAVA